MSTALIDDGLLGTVLRGSRPRQIASKQLHTTGLWYVRLCQAVLASTSREGALSKPFLHLPPGLRERSLAALVELPDEVGMLSLRSLGPTMAGLRQAHTLNVLGLEALAAAATLDADVYLTTSSPMLEQALADNRIRCTTVRVPQR